MTTFALLGTERDDSLQLHYTEGSTHYDLRENPHAGSMVAEVYGRSGSGWITGSDRDSSGYQEFLYGGPDLDSIYGGEGDDHLDGGGVAAYYFLGHDSLHGEGGDDVLTTTDSNPWRPDHQAVSMDGGAGNDTLWGDYTAKNLLIGGDGADTVVGGVYDDLIYGQDGNDTLLGGSGVDTIYGGEDDDTIEGGPGGDQLYGEGGVDSIDGGDGGDVIQGGSGGDIIVGRDGIDRIYGQEGDDTIDGGLMDDELYGGSGNDTMWGQDGVDLLSGGTGNDVLDGGPGNDRLWGHGGSDTIQGRGGEDTIAGGPGNDFLYGGTEIDTIWGQNGHDQIAGGDGGDHLAGNDGNDTINGGDGMDTVLGGSGADGLFGGPGDDDVIGGSGNDTLCETAFDADGQPEPALWNLMIGDNDGTIEIGTFDRAWVEPNGTSMLVPAGQNDIEEVTAQWDPSNVLIPLQGQLATTTPYPECVDAMNLGSP